MPKQLTALRAIRLTCSYCMGERRDFIRECQASTDSNAPCALHPYRMGSIEPGASRRLLKVAREFCLACAGGPGGVKDCTAGPGCAAKGFVPCVLFPFRLGKSPNIREETRIQRRETALKRVAQGYLPGVSGNVAPEAETGSRATVIIRRTAAPGARSGTSSPPR